MLVAGCLLGGFLLPAPARADPPARPTYWQDIRPVLRRNCTVCHSSRNLQDADVSGGLALDSYEAIRKGAREPVIRPGDSQASPLVQRITTADEDRRMPRGATPLPPETITLLRRWIDTGASEGPRPADTAPAVAAGGSRRRRKLDVTLLTRAVPPRGLFGPARPARLELALKVGPLAPVTAVAFSPDGKLLATGRYRQVTLWDLAAVRPVRMLTNVLGTVNDVRFSPDGSLLAVAGGQPSAKGDLRLYRVADGSLAATLGGHEDVVFAVAFSPDGKSLASASFDKTVRIWDLGRRKPRHIFTGHADFVYSVAFSPDGRWLVSGSKDRSAKRIETADGKGRFTFSGTDQEVLAVAVRPDGKAIVTGSSDGRLSWWNPETGLRIRVQGGHGGAVHELCFSRDGRWLVSAGADQTVRVWNGATGGLLRTLPVGSIVYAVAISPDGRRIASGSFDGLVRLWDPGTGRQLLAQLAVPAARDQTDWLALTPEGYTAASPGLAHEVHWRMAGQGIAAEPVWKALGRPEDVVKAVQGAKLAPPRFSR